MQGRSEYRWWSRLALTSSWIMNFELRYQLVSDFDQAVFNLGFAYRF